MSTVATLVIGLAILVVYSLVGGLTYAVLDEWVDGDLDYAFAAFAASVLWPVGLPIALSATIAVWAAGKVAAERRRDKDEARARVFRG